MFQPHSDSWLLGESLTREPLGPGSRVLDLCTGSGLLAVLSARRGATTYAVDVSRLALLSARLNARLNGARVHALRGSLWDPVGARRFDVIVSNPPYLPSSDPEPPRHGPERAWDAGLTGRVFLDAICTQASEHLSPGGVLLLTQSTVCGEKQTLDQLAAAGLESRVIVRHHGPLGERLTARATWLARRGLLPDGSLEEDILIIRARLPVRRRALRTPAATAAGDGSLRTGPVLVGDRDDEAEHRRGSGG